MDYEKEIELKRQEAGYHGKIAEFYRKEVERVQIFAVVSISILVVIMIAIVIIFRLGPNGKPMSGGEHFPVMNPAS